MNPIRLVNCAECKGLGRIIKETKVMSKIMGKMVRNRTHVQCPKCKGVGRVPQIGK